MGRDKEHMNKDAFLDRFRTSLGATHVERMLTTCVVLPCHCGQARCLQWAFVVNNPEAIARHMDTHGKAR